MLRYCGRRGRVLRRVERLIDEKTGRCSTIKSDCIIIDGFICTGDSTECVHGASIRIGARPGSGEQSHDAACEWPGYVEEPRTMSDGRRGDATYYTVSDADSSSAR